MDLINELKQRKLLAQCTNLEKLESLLNKEKLTFYIGFDPTASALHIGHYMQMKNIKYLKEAGHKPIVIFGVGTAMIGDPSGRTDMRKMLTVEELNRNVEGFKKIMSKYFNVDEVMFVNNADWLLKLNYVDFLREVGVHYSVNRMLSVESVKSRLEVGLTFLEFNYMLMQGYDFYRLYKDYNCVLQLGGDDQWSNIISGVELTRRKDGKEIYGLTTSLLLDANGVKMGKTMGNALWIDPDKTPPYEFYQFYRNLDDSLVTDYMKMLTFMPLEEIAEFEGYKDEKINLAKEKLAYEVTKAVHDEDEAKKAQEAARTLFAGGGISENMPTTVMSAHDFTDDEIAIADLLVLIKLASSKSDARRLIEQGGIYVDDKKIADVGYKINQAELREKDVIVKKGKKVFHRLKI